MDSSNLLVLVRCMAILLALYEVYIVLLLLLSLEHERTKLQMVQLLDSSSQLARRKSRHNRRIERQPQRYWVKPGRTSSWWDNFLNNEVPIEEWKDNFRMSRSSFFLLCQKLKPLIQRRTTIMREPVSVETQVALTLYYLSDECRLRKTANSFGLARSTVSVTIRRVCAAISNHLGPQYIKLPTTVTEVE